MSFHRENVTWQSPDGTWNRGFFAVDYYECGQDEDVCGDETHEWCAEYGSDFDWVSTGHATKEGAERSWDGANPGGWTIVDNCLENASVVAEYEDEAAKMYERALESSAKHGSDSTGVRYWGGGFTSSRSTAYWGYHGPAKTRTLAAVQRERNQILEDWVGHRLGGYANGRDEQRLARLNEQVERMVKAAPGEVDAYEERESQFRDKVRDRIAQATKRQSESRRPAYGYGYGGYSSSAAAISLDRSDKLSEVEKFLARADADAKARPAARVKVKGPTKKTDATKKSAQPNARGKTTAKSTSGSYKAHVKPEASGVDLVTAPSAASPSGSGPVDVDHLWG